MASLAARYAAGEHEAVWRPLDFDLLPIKEQFELGYKSQPTLEEAEDIMRQTFERVARKTDTLITRLRDLGYKFECEVGRFGSANPPRSPALDHAEKARSASLERFGGLAETETGSFPLALTLFAEIVGNVDLRQRYPESVTVRAEDPVLARLGDWDPLQVDFAYLASGIGEEEAELSLLPEGGLALTLEFAGSFEHKADISGAWNPNFRLPSYRVDPMVFAEGIALPFTTYLRHIFSLGGFFGSPRPFFRASHFSSENGIYLPEADWPPIREVEPGIWLPDHPIFSELARDLETF